MKMSHIGMEAELTCPICFELFHRPRRLPCGHSYCHSCINAILSKNAEETRSYLSFSRLLICPECRDEVSLDFVEGVEAIPLDFKLTKLVELFQYMKKSDPSDSDEVSTSARTLESKVHVTASASSSSTTSSTYVVSSGPCSGELETLQSHSALSDEARGVDDRGDDFSSQRSSSNTVPSSNVYNHSGQNSPLSDAHESETTDQNNCIGAIGGFFHVQEELHRNSPGQDVIPQGEINSGARNAGVNLSHNSDEDLQYIASALSPSVTLSGQQLPGPSNTQTKLDYSQSYNELPSYHSQQVPGDGQLARAQSLPPESQHNVSSRRNSRHEVDGRTKDSKSSVNSKRPKKKKGISWKSLFVDYSSSSDDSYSSDIEDQETSKPQVPEVKKGRLVTRFLKSIILSDSSSSDWSDDEEKNCNRKTENQSSVQGSNLEVRAQVSTDIQSDANTHTLNIHSDEHSRRLRHSSSESQPRSCTESNKGQVCAPSSPTDIPSQKTLNAHPSIDSNTELKQVVPPIPQSADTNLSESSNQFVSHHMVNNSSNFNDHNDAGLPGNNSITEGCVCPDSTTVGRVGSPTYYDNMQVGISELDVLTPPVHQTNSQPIENPTFYDNVNPPEHVSDAKTLYDNITDSDLIQCRLQAQAIRSDSRPVHAGNENSAAEIENLKTGFEDMERVSSASSNLPASIHIFNSLQPVSSSSIINSPEPGQLPMTSATKPFTHEIENLKEMYACAPSSAEQANGAYSLAQPPSSRHSLHETGKMHSLYDNMGPHSIAKSSRNNDQAIQQQNTQILHPPLHPNQMDFLHLQRDSFEQQPFSHVMPAIVHPTHDEIASQHATSFPTVPPKARETRSDSARNEPGNAGNCDANDDNNNVSPMEAHEEEDDIHDEEARMLQPRRRPRSKFRKFITSLLSLSSSSDEDEPYYVNNTSSSSKSSDW